MSESKVQYCRFCGKDKGHNTGACKNVREMRRIIAQQDDQIKNLEAHSHRNEGIEKELAQSKSNLQFVHRLITCLLDLNDAYRARLPK